MAKTKTKAKPKSTGYQSGVQKLLGQRRGGAAKRRDALRAAMTSSPGHNTKK